MLIDWVQCTLSDPSGAIKEWIQGSLRGAWVGINRAPYQYTCTLRCGGVSIYTGVPNNDNIRLVISGEGCRELENAGAVSSWQAYLAKLLRFDAKFSRLDAAIDDRATLLSRVTCLSMDTILLCSKEGRVVSPYNKITPIEPVCATTGKIIGRAISFGERASKTMVRIYDKAMKEQDPEHWIRVELETHDDKAQALAQAIAEGSEDVVPRILLGCLGFKVRGTAGRRERWKTEEWWTAFLGTEERFHLGTAPRDESMQKSYDWLIRCVSRIFTLVYYSKIGKNLVADLLAHGTQKQDRKPLTVR